LAAHPARRARWRATGSVLVVLLAGIGCSASSSHQIAAPDSRLPSSASSESTADASLDPTATPVAAGMPSQADGHHAGRPSVSATAGSGGGAGTGGGAGSAGIAGCALFPSDNPWRRNVSGDPVDPRSADWVASIGAGTHLHPDFGSDPSYGIPYVVVPAGQAKVPITFTDYGDESDPGPYPVPANAPVEGGGDAHVLVASANCILYELYGAKKTATGWSAASGAVFNLKSDALRPDGWTSADAAGLPILPGLVRRDKIAAGHIDHALRFTISKSQKGFIHPATHAAGSSTDANVPPMGARFRLKASFDLSPYHGAALIILQALKTYGMFVADNGSNWYLSGTTDTGWNDDDLNQLKSIPGSVFEAVSSGPVLH
jgi:hypothetical protein